jgi:putative drug exporter of the RND superfamily
MVRLSRWCIAHRRWVIGGWVLIAVLTTVIAGAVGRKYATDFSLPGTESQHVVDLLGNEFKAQSGDVDTIVFHTSKGSVADPAVRNAITPLLGKVAQMPHVVSVISP